MKMRLEVAHLTRLGPRAATEMCNFQMKIAHLTFAGGNGDIANIFNFHGPMLGEFLRKVAHLTFAFY